MRLLENKTSIITGAGSGIGMETVKLFAESGSNIILAGRRLAPLEKIRSLHSQSYRIPDVNLPF